LDENSPTKIPLQLANTYPLRHQPFYPLLTSICFEFVSTGSNGEDIAVRKNCTYFYFTNLSLAQKTRFKLSSSLWLVMSLINPLLISICTINASTESNGEDLFRETIVSSLSITNLSLAQEIRFKNRSNSHDYFISIIKLPSQATHLFDRNNYRAFQLVF